MTCKMLQHQVRQQYSALHIKGYDKIPKEYNNNETAALTDSSDSHT